MQRIEELTETMQELSDELMDVNDLLQTPLAPVDDEEVLRELNEMEAEAALQEMKLPLPVATVPFAVPSPVVDAGTMVATA